MTSTPVSLASSSLTWVSSWPSAPDTRVSTWPPLLLSCANCARDSCNIIHHHHCCHGSTLNPTCMLGVVDRVTVPGSVWAGPDAITGTRCCSCWCCCCNCCWCCCCCCWSLSWICCCSSLCAMLSWARLASL